MMMKRAVSFVLLGLGLAVLGGCPIYPDDRNHRVCIGGDCYDCPNSYYSSSGCGPWSCNSNLDCPGGYSCSSDRRCHLTDGNPPGPPGGTVCTKPSDCPTGSNCGADNRCHAGDCSTTGCPTDFVCKLTGGVPQCVSKTGTGTTSSCKSDKDCTASPGSKCLSGECVAPVNQCADATQCQPGFQCVGGSCTPSCGPTKPCPTGYACNNAKGVCTNNPSPCTTSAQCTGGAVCVDEHCVAACGPGNTCAPGLVCIDGGCTPDEKPSFTCAADGEGTGCLSGSLCIRHSCYVKCDAAVPDSCKTVDKFNICKSVTTLQTTYNVCGSDTNLGTECDPTQNNACAQALVCIDGYCK